MNVAPWLAPLFLLALGPDEGRLDEYRGGGALAFSPDGRRLLTHGSEGMRVWDLETRMERPLTGASSFPRSRPERHAAFSADGKEVTLYESERLVAWSLQGGTRVRTVRGPTAFLDLSLLSADGTAFAAAASADGKWTLWVFAHGREKPWSVEVAGDVASISMTPGGDRVVLAGTGGGSARDGWVRAWEVASGRELFSAKVSAPGAARNVIVRLTGGTSPDGKLLAGTRTPGTHVPGKAGGASRIQLWDLEKGEVAAELEGQRGEVWDAAFSRDGSRLIAWGPADVTAWDVAGRKPLLSRAGIVYSASLSPDGTTLVFLAGADILKSKERTAVAVDLASNRDLFTLPAAYYQDLAFSPDGKTLAVSSDGRVALLDPASGAERKPPK